jgi:hypothetical protein
MGRRNDVRGASGTGFVSCWPLDDSCVVLGIRALLADVRSLRDVPLATSH